jgi:hypothetical protein
MSIIQKLKIEILPGTTMRTPSGRADFEIESINDDGVTFRVGPERKWKTRVPSKCWEGIPDYLRGRGWVRIGASHDPGEAGTLEAYLDPVVKTSASSYVVPVLEKIGVVEIDYEKPAKIRLKE